MSETATKDIVSEGEIVEHEDRLPLREQNEQRHQVATNGPASPQQLLQIAIERGDALEKLEKLIDLSERYEKNEARKAFHEAMTRFKAEPLIITKDKTNKQYDSQYSSLGNMVNTVNVALSKAQLNARWTLDQNEGVITVTCILSHALGHSEVATLSGPPDTSGSKNALQQVKSTVTYLEGATFQAVTGIGLVDKNINPDDDGNGAGNAHITDEQVADLQALAEEVGADVAKFLKYMKVEEFDEIPAAWYDRAVKALEQKRSQS